MNSTLEEIHSRVTEAETRINDLEDRMVEITVAEQNTEKRMKRNCSPRDLWNNIKHTNICITGAPEEETGLGEKVNILSWFICVEIFCIISSKK